LSADLAGQVWISPGAPLGRALRSTRPMLAPRLLEGRPARQVPALVAAAFTLCAHAQRWTAERALQAALGHEVQVSSADLQAHQAATAREHLLRIAHDWPRWWPEVTQTLGLQGCPLWPARADVQPALSRLPDWLARHWLDQPATDWLAQVGPLTPETKRWARHADSPLASMLHRQASAATALTTPGLSLVAGAVTQSHWASLAGRMLDEPRFCAQPDWLGQAADTGPWCRAWDHPGSAALQPQALTVWDRWWARLRELVHLALPQGQGLLAHGTWHGDEHTGLAWTETARGLLVHVVQLSDASPEARVLRYRVLAPTEWNFHPQGALGQALSALPQVGSEHDALRLTTAFDPCVGFELAPFVGATPLMETTPCA
jgi:hypothetical protein